MLPFGVTIPATVPQRSEIPEGLTNYPVFITVFFSFFYTLQYSVTSQGWNKAIHNKKRETVSEGRDSVPMKHKTNVCICTFYKNTHKELRRTAQVLEQLLLWGFGKGVQ